ncbi:PAS domain-containing sensor histidine kinase [Colwelliaceae bacterium 6441]
MFNLNSLEKYLSVKLFIFALPSVAFLVLFEWQAAMRWQWIVVSVFALLLFIFWSIAVIKYRVMRSYTRASLHLDAIKQEDYNQFAKSSFPQGKVKEFHQQLNQLSDHLQHQKSSYDQHIFLVYQLIGQLESPVMVFNQKQHLSFANEAFYAIYKQPWQMYRQSTPEHLGLSYDGKTWHLQSSNKKWQVKHSQFIDNGEMHQLLVFIDIESALREGQLQAWQQIIRVLSHEIRNSLTPVSSMAETLADKCLIERDKKILQVITERCLHLQSFVDRYSTLSKKIELNRHKISIPDLCHSLSKLFNNFPINFDYSVDYLWADISFFEQVLINLIKNAKEANATKVQINFSEHEQHFIIEVIDDGHGFSNLDNLFVPLYSTKTDGQGIGLSFCRNVIEQHQGVIELDNNDEQGVTIMIILPRPNSI